MFASTSCRNPLCPIPHKVFRNHAAYTRHLNSSTGCCQYIRTGTSASANQPLHPAAKVVATSTKSSALLRSQFVNHDHTSAVFLQEPSLATAPIYPPEIDKAASSDDDFQGLGADDDSYRASA